MKNILKEEKGITLIALFVTVIVMILLSRLVIEVSINSKLIDTTKQAVEDTNDKETQIEGRVEGILDDYWEDVTDFKVSKNPTYKMSIRGLNFWIDEETTWQECIDKSNGFVQISHVEDYCGYSGDAIHIKGVGGIICPGNEETYRTPAGSISNNSKVKDLFMYIENYDSEMTPVLVDMTSPGTYYIMTMVEI